MGPGKNGVEGRDYTMPVRLAEARAVRRIVEDRFGKGRTAGKRWLVCGDLNDYRERIVVTGDRQTGYGFDPVTEKASGIDPLVLDGFSVDLAGRRDVMERWTLYHARGPEEQHLCQLDYLLASPSLADKNARAVPEIIYNGQPYRTPFPPGQEVERYPRTGWDRPKASDHSPMVVQLDMV